MQSYTKGALSVLDIAIRFSDAADDGYIGTEHLLLGLLTAKTENDTPCIAAKLLSARGIHAAAVTETLYPSRKITIDPSTDTADMTAHIADAEPLFTPVLSRILIRAKEEAERFRLASGPNGEEVGTEHLLFSLLCETDAAAHRLLARQNLPLHELYGDILSFLSAVTAEQAIFSGSPDLSGDADVKSAEHPSARKDSTQAPSYLLDMTAQAAAGKYDTVVGRASEEESVLRILLHRQKNNACLLGEAGVGKTAIVEGLVARIAHGNVPARLSGARIFSLDLGSMLAGAKYRGEFEERLRRVLAFCREQTTPVILFIDEVHMLMGAGAAEGTVDAANLLKPALSRGEIRVIGATTTAEYDRSIASDGAMSRRFQCVSVEEPSEAAACDMIGALRPRLEIHHGVCIPRETVACAVAVSVRCLPEQYLPDKAIDLLDDACAAVAAAHAHTADIHSAQKRRDDALLAGDLSAAVHAVHCNAAETEDRHMRPTVGKDDIFLAAQRRTGISLDAEDHSARIARLRRQLEDTVIGQKEAIAAIIDALRRHSAALDTDRRTPLSFLFYGPSGVGKRAVCEAIADLLFDTPHAFLPFDMSEYREAHTVSRLIGAPPGYIGHSDGGMLTAAVRHRPYALLLFDGIEHAHPDVIRLILQILDSGTLTDSRGTAVSFRHTIVVLTQDTSASHATRPLGFVSPSDTLTSDTVPKNILPIDVTSHVDAQIFFRTLDDTALSQMLQARLTSLVRRMADRGITLLTDDVLLPYLLRHLPKDRGTRVFCRMADQITEQPIAEALLDGTLQNGDRIRLTVIDNEVRLISDNENT